MVDLGQVHQKVLPQVINVTRLRKKLFVSLEYLIDVGPAGGVLLEAVVYEIVEALLPPVVLVQRRGRVVHDLQNDFHSW